MEAVEQENQASASPVLMQIKGQPLTVTAETIIATREHFAEIAQSCIDDIQAGKITVNEPAKCIAWYERMRDDHLAGKDDHNVTFLQRAVWIQTGDCPSLLS